MIFGAHLRISEGVDKVIAKAQKMGLSAIQIFISPPQNFSPPSWTKKEIFDFASRCRQAGIKYIFFHSIYLINLASKNPFLLQNAKRSLIDYLNINAQMEGSGVIFHIGSTKGKSFTEVKPQIIAAINEILEKSDSRSILILETSAGAGNTIGDTFEELKDIYQGIKQKKRVGFCLDTAHTFASGYDWNKNPAAIVEEFDKTLGLKNLKVVHLNDSKSGLSSHIDRHENVGQGRLGKETIRQILHLPVFQNLPLILEVPGFANQGTDEKNIKILRELAR